MLSQFNCLKGYKNIQRRNRICNIQLCINVNHKESNENFNKKRNQVVRVLSMLSFYSSTYEKLTCVFYIYSYLIELLLIEHVNYLMKV